MTSAAVPADLTAFFKVTFQRVQAAVAEYGRTQDARSLEALVQGQLNALGAVLLERCWQARQAARGHPGSLPCGCGRRRHLVARRERVVRGVLGEYHLTERYYYRCDQCGATAYWGDELRGATDFTPLAEERLALAGKDGAYERAAELLTRLGVIGAAGSTVREVCERLGERARQAEARATAEQYGAAAVAPEEHPPRLALGVDGTMLGRIDLQHRRRRSRKTGRKVRGKTRLQHFFQEVKTLVAFDFDRRGRAGRKTYVATQARVELFRERVALEAHRRGAELAARLVFLGDGSPWIWKTAAELFPQALQVLDWYHAVEHLWDVGRARYGSDETAVRAWAGRQATRLWEGRQTELELELRRAARELGTPDARLAVEARERDARWIARRNVEYFRENRARMDYPRFRALGLPVSSGVVESACKHVVAERLKRSGMRWDEPGAENLLELRCLDLNGRWDTLWPDKRVA